MSYVYKELKKDLFTEQGQIAFLKIRDHVKLMLNKAGAITMEKAMVAGGNSWLQLACVDRLVELGEIREITKENEVAAQHRVFVAS
jgi:hypothetical protein